MAAVISIYRADGGEVLTHIVTKAPALIIAEIEVFIRKYFYKRFRIYIIYGAENVSF